MTIFNSKKINTDKFPWSFCDSEGETRFRENPAPDDDLAPYVAYAPRPEFDNNPNPILVELRRAFQVYFHRDLAVRHYLEYVGNDVYDWRGMDEEKAHARKVLQRLANLTTTTEGNPS